MTDVRRCNSCGNVANTSPRIAKEVYMLTDISERSFKHLQFQYVTSHRNKSRGSEVVNSIQQTQVRIVSGVDVVCIRDEEAKIDAITYNASISLRSVNAVRQVRVRSVTCDYTARPRFRHYQDG
jgi:tRNA(Ile2) C34 agmatinyltransferase TiaS